MATVMPRTVGQSLYWSYANLAMAFASAQHRQPTYQKTDYIVRSKVYYGLSRGKLQLGSFLKDEKCKIACAGSCSYCGSEEELSLDHLIPQFKGGEHSADNLVEACRSCNSSKKALDLLEWMAKREEFPPLFLLRRYLKLAIHYCRKNGLMEIRLVRSEDGPEPLSLFDGLEPGTPADSADSRSIVWPFAVELVPYTFPDPAELWDCLPSGDDS